MKIHKLTLAALLVAIGTLSAHLIYIPAGISKCFPVQHAINVLGAVILGPGYATAVAFVISCHCAICSVPAHCWLFPAV